MFLGDPVHRLQWRNHFIGALSKVRNQYQHQYKNTKYNIPPQQFPQGGGQRLHLNKRPGNLLNGWLRLRADSGQITRHRTLQSTGVNGIPQWQRQPRTHQPQNTQHLKIILKRPIPANSTNLLNHFNFASANCENTAATNIPKNKKQNPQVDQAGIRRPS